MCSDGLRAWNSKLGRWVSNIHPPIACIMPVLSRHCLSRCEHCVTNLDEIWVYKDQGFSAIEPSRFFFNMSIRVPLTLRLDVMALSYHSWAGMAAIFSFCCTYRML